MEVIKLVKSEYYKSYTELLQKDTMPTIEELKAIGYKFSYIRANMMYLIAQYLKKFHNKVLIIDKKTQDTVDVLFGVDKKKLTTFIEKNKLKIENGIRNTDITGLDNWALIKEIEYQIYIADSCRILDISKLFLAKREENIIKEKELKKKGIFQD